MKKTLLGLVLLVSFCAMHASDNNIEKTLEGKMRGISPQASRHLQRLGSAQLLAQNEIDCAKKEGRAPILLAQQVVNIPTTPPRAMWEKITAIQKQIKAQ